MEIWGGLQQLTPRSADRERKAGELRKSDIVSDLFNNQKNQGTDRADSKLRLSKTARVLSQRLDERVDDFLSENNDAQNALNEIDLDGAPAARKLRSYVQWLDIRQPESAELEDLTASEQPYLDLHRTGHDHEIREIFAQYETERQGSLTDRQRHAPNYYYLAYPETYSFN